MSDELGKCLGECLCQILCYCFVQCAAELCNEACKQGCCDQCCRELCPCCIPTQPAAQQQKDYVRFEDNFPQFEDKHNPHAPVIDSNGKVSFDDRGAYPEGWFPSAGKNETKIVPDNEEKKVDVYDDAYYSQAQKEMLKMFDTQPNNTNIMGTRPSQMVEPNDDALNAYYQQLKEEQNKAYNFK